MRIELTWSRKLSSKCDSIIKVIVFFYLFILLQCRKLFFSQVSIFGKIELADCWRFLLILKMFNGIEIGLFLDIEINLIERGRFISLYHRPLHLIPRWLRIGTSDRGKFIKIGHLWFSGNFEFFLTGTMLVIFKSALQDLFLWVAFAMRSDILLEPEVVVEGMSTVECLGLHK